MLIIVPYKNLNNQSILGRPQTVDSKVMHQAIITKSSE